MMSLSDYFTPLLPLNIFYYLLMILFFDFLGTSISKVFFKEKTFLKEIRAVNWVIGLGLFVFLWFVLGFILVPSSTNLLLSIILLLLFGLRTYIDSGGFQFLLKAVKEIFPYALLVLPFLPAVFVKASLPPYYSDEMAYHFISPYAANHNLSTFWRFDGGALMNAPRLVDTFFILGFSLFKTYSIVRLTLFTLLATAVTYAGYLFGKKFNKLVGFALVLLFFSLPQSIVFTSTIGYVDIPAYSFLILSLAFLVSAIGETNRKESLLAGVLFAVMSVGTKYTVINAFASIALIFALLQPIQFIKDVFNKAFLLKAGLVSIMFGVYWYIKNFVVYGNPLYPFIFPCWGKYALECGRGEAFFGDWTVKVTWQNAAGILNDLFPSSLYIVALSLLSLSLFLFLWKKSESKAIAFLAGAFVLEMLSLKLLSGFHVRYHQHMQVLLIMVAAIFIGVLFYSKKVNKLLGLLLVLLVFLVSIKNYFKVIDKSNSLRTVTWEEINYSLGRTDIYDWIENRLPEVSQAVFWCEDPPGETTALARFDPDMIWFEDAGFMRSFLLNCYYENPRLDFSSDLALVESAKENKISFWTATINSCINQSEVMAKREEETETEVQMRRKNNIVVCKSEEVLPNLYYFDYRSL